MAQDVISLQDSSHDDSPPGFSAHPHLPAMHLNSLGFTGSGKVISNVGSDGHQAPSGWRLHSDSVRSHEKIVAEHIRRLLEKRAEERERSLAYVNGLAWWRRSLPKLSHYLWHFIWCLFRCFLNFQIQMIADFVSLSFGFSSLRFETISVTNLSYRLSYPNFDDPRRISLFSLLSWSPYSC